MKKFTFVLFALLLLFNFTFSQSTISWKKANIAKTDNWPSKLLKDAEGSTYILFYEKTAFEVVKSFALNKYSSDLQFESKVPLNVAGGESYSISVVGDYICFAGHNSSLPNSKSNYAIFYNLEGEEVRKVEVDEQYNIESIFLSKDKNNIIITAYNKVNNPDKKMDKNYFVKVYAYDKNFELVNEQAFQFEQIFSNLAEISSLDFDLTADKKLVALCRTKSKPGKAQLNLASFDKSDSKPNVYKYLFNDSDVSYKYTIGKGSEIIISGVISAGVSLKSNSNKTLYFINQSLETEKTANIVTYDIAKQLCVTFPESKKLIQANQIDPFQIFTMSDGILFGAMHMIQSTTYSSSGSSKTRYFSKNFVFIKFSFTGELQWLKTINKELNCEEANYEMALMGYKQFGDELMVVYNDNPANIINVKGKLVKALPSKAVPALSRINSNGTITTKPLDKLSKGNTLNCPAKTFFSEDELILIGYKRKGFSRPDYFVGKVSVGE